MYFPAFAAGGGEAWMQAIGSPARAAQTAGEFAREEDVAKLGTAIGLPAPKLFAN